MKMHSLTLTLKNKPTRNILHNNLYYILLLPLFINLLHPSQSQPTVSFQTAAHAALQARQANTPSACMTSQTHTIG